MAGSAASPSPAVPAAKAATPGSSVPPELADPADKPFKVGLGLVSAVKVVGAGSSPLAV
jgi:hypothetical protein